MDKTQSSENTSSSNGENTEKANAKKEKNPPKDNVTDTWGVRLLQFCVFLLLLQRNQL